MDIRRRSIRREGCRGRWQRCRTRCSRRRESRGQAGQAVGHAAETAGKAVAGAAGAAFQAIKTYRALGERHVLPIRAKGSLKVDLDGKGGGSVKAGVIVDGSIVPPKIKDFAAYAGMSFDVDASVVIKAAILVVSPSFCTLHADDGVGGYESGRMSVIKPIGLPGLSIPGAYDRTTSRGESVTGFEDRLERPSCVQSGYLELWYPKAKKASVEKVYIPSPLVVPRLLGDTAVNRSPICSPQTQGESKGQRKRTLNPIPQTRRLRLAGKAGADVFLEADALPGCTCRCCPAAGKKGKRDIYVPPYAYGSRRRDVSVQDGSDGAPAAGVKAGFSGCVDLSAGLELNYGAKANAGDLWKVNESGSLWKSPIWPIWSGCFEAGTKAAKPAGKSSWDPATLEKKFKEKKLTCDATDVGDLEGIPDESLPAKT
ncbi:hypothetical protein IMY05_C4833000300 [Salix suchowensis]|nr:hypothetical protein IMY05_C4833000300 [Salix suchowensis]